MRVIGILIDKGKDSVLKNLKPGWYPFGNYQCPTSKNGWQWMTEEQKMADEYCNKLYKSVAEDEPFPKNMTITVNSIVGTNGSGKTTLLEIFFRIINNFSYYLFDKGWHEGAAKNNPQLGHELHEALGLSATLFFETDGYLGGIKCNKEGVSYIYKGIKEEKVNLPVHKYLTTTRLQNLLRPFFYTICSNYSIYSFNETGYEKDILHSYEKEVDNDWISGIMHKNDGYLAPIVMVPYREEDGYIDVNKENGLARQRLSTLALLFLSQNKPFMAEYEPVVMNYRFRSESTKIYKDKMERFVRGRIANYRKEMFTTIKKEWSKALVAIDGYQNKPPKVKDAIISYLTYKTIKISATYREYGQLLGIRSPREGELVKFGEKERKKYCLVDLPENYASTIVGKMINEDTPSHITLKIHQLLEFVKRGLYLTGETEEERKIAKDSTLAIYEVKDLKAFLQKNLNYDNQHKFKEKNRNRYETYDDVFLITPPAIFEWEIKFRKENSEGDSEPLSLDGMSSGEKQVMQSFSYILYHIKNIQSVKENEFHIPYHHVNLIFDEAELYYHPEFQRDFIKKLIQMLGWCHIDGRKIRSINITVVTHSPFVLSDVMVDHTLNMDNGVVMEKHKQTFGANIHNLLYNQFIDDSIGAVVRKAVDTIVSLYQEIDKDDNMEKLLNNYPYYEFLTSSIAEPYLKNNLVTMLEEAKMKVEQAKMKHHELLERMMEKEVKLRRELEGVRQQIESLKEEKDEEN